MVIWGRKQGKLLRIGMTLYPNSKHRNNFHILKNRMYNSRQKELYMEKDQRGRHGQLFSARVSTLALFRVTFARRVRRDSGVSILEMRMQLGLERMVMSSYLFFHPPTAGKPPTQRQNRKEDIQYLFPVKPPPPCSLTQAQWGRTSETPLLEVSSCTHTTEACSERMPHTQMPVIPAPLPRFSRHAQALRKSHKK